MSTTDPGDPPQPRDAPDDAPERSPRRMRPAALVWGFAAGLALVLLAVLVISVVRREHMTRLTEADFEAAAERWDQNGPANYNLDLELSGTRPGKIHVEVREGRPVRMTRDGVEPRQERTWYTWTVPGQFDTIAQELEMARDPAGSFDSPKATQVIIWAEFDPRYGYPLRYDRVVLGADFETHWRTVRFEPLPGG